MSDVPAQIIVAVFKDPYAAGQAMEDLKLAKKRHWIAVDDAAVLTKDADGKLRIKDTKDMGGGKGMVIGAVVGGAIGLLTGGVGLLALGGGALGGLGAKLRDGGLPDARLRELGEAMPPNSSALVAVIEHTSVADAEQALRDVGADVVTASLTADIAAQLKAGGDVAYTVVGDGDEVIAARAADDSAGAGPAADGTQTGAKPAAAPTTEG
jgi:uncharacterized membrane protein